ncbi:MAG: MAE_28990/MAE_18760 family HEPN-like nuclease [Candidatus Nanopelagicaceae bacterium]|nr:MAE_28990/MAE_18760 family HEPN-like nuclease [Candidatus Nanopelagicaceae bacterium]
MIDVDPHIVALRDRIDVVYRLIDRTHPGTGASDDISREARGLTIVLLYAAYENLLTSLTRTLLEKANRSGVSNRRLQPNFRMFAVANFAQSFRDDPEKRLYSGALRQLVEVANKEGRGNTIDSNHFPKGGDFMKITQIRHWSEIFAIGDPSRILHRTWQSIDGVVSGRNGIAHGQLTPQDVGRSITELEIRQLANNWLLDWTDFLRHVALLTANRDFFRLPR